MADISTVGGSCDVTSMTCDRRGEARPNGKAANPKSYQPALKKRFHLDSFSSCQSFFIYNYNIDSFDYYSCISHNLFYKKSIIISNKIQILY